MMPVFQRRGKNLLPFTRLGSRPAASPKSPIASAFFCHSDADLITSLSVDVKVSSAMCRMTCVSKSRLDFMYFQGCRKEFPHLPAACSRASSSITSPTLTSISTRRSIIVRCTSRRRGSRSPTLSLLLSNSWAISRRNARVERVVWFMPVPEVAMVRNHRAKPQPWMILPITLPSSMRALWLKSVEV